MTTPARPLLIAHRGESHLAPENTLAAFSLAWQLGASAIELDVHLSADGEVVVCHDADTFRTSGKATRLVIAESTYAQLRTVEVGGWKDARYRGEPIPLLAEVLAQAPPTATVFIELKPADPALVHATIAVLKASRRPPTLLPVICFHPSSLAEFRACWPDGSPTYLLSGFTQGVNGSWQPSVEDLIAAATACSADGLDVQNRSPLDQDFIARVHAAGMPCYVWTEDNPAAARSYAAAGIDGITTNRAAWMREHLSSHP